MRLASRSLLAFSVLALFGVGASTCWSAGSGRTVFNIVDYGARNDGSALATDAFRKAIQAAKAAGGGTVYVPPGKYISGPVELVSNMTLDIDAGATVTFPAMVLPFTPGRQQGIETLTPVPLIGGTNLENVTITGRGTLASSNADWMKLHARIEPTGTDPGSANGPHWEALLRDLEAKLPVSKAEYEAVAAELRPSFVRFMNSRNVLVENVRFLGSPMWTVHLLYTERAIVRGVTIETYPGVHTDGIVVDSSRFVRLSDDYIDTGDDGIVIKSGKDSDGLRVNRPTEDVAITNCTVHHAHGAVTIGSETSGGVRNIVASNITAVDTVNGIRIKSRRGRGGVVEDVRFDNWTMENVGTAIDVTNYYLMEGETRTTEEPVSARTPTFRNIAISNVSISGAKTVIDVEGLPEMPLAGLRLSNIIGSGKTAMRADHTRGLELHNVNVSGTAGPAFAIANASSLLLDDVSSSSPAAGAPVVRLTHSAGAVMQNSRAFPGTGVFLSVGLGELKDIRLENSGLVVEQK